MKEILLSLLLVSFFTGSISAQGSDHRRSVSDSLQVYLQANYDKDYDKIMDMVYPKLFDIVAREDMIAMFKGMESEGIEFELSDGLIHSISEVMVEDGKRFSRVDYSMKMMMRFSGIEYESEATQDIIHTSFQAQYGEDNVSRKEGAFYIQTDKTMIAIAPIGEESWKFMEMNRDQPQLLEMLLPVEIIEAFSK